MDPEELWDEIEDYADSHGLDMSDVDDWIFEALADIAEQHNDGYAG